MIQRLMPSFGAVSKGNGGGLIASLLVLGGAWAGFPGNVWAHGETTVTPETAWSAWNGDPLLVLGLLVAVGLYARGIRQLWGRAGVGTGVRRWQVAAFGGGLAALVVALVSPLEAVAGALFSAHMVQHLILILGAAPLLILGTPLFVWLWGLPARWRKAIGRGWRGSRVLRPLWDVLSHPLVVWTLYAATMWLWHAPPLFEAALHSDFLHELEHMSFLGASMLFCWVLINPMGRRRLTRGTGILYLFTTSVHGSLLGVLITFAPHPWYEHYVEATQAWGLSPLQDQQLAGVIMWIPVGMVYAGLAALLFVLWMKDIEMEIQTVERRSPGLQRRSPTYPPEEKEI